AVNSSPNDVSILLGNGDGTFQTAVNYNTGSSPHGIAIADFNRDGVPDLAIVNECGTDLNCRIGSVSILFGNGDGSFRPGPVPLLPLSPLSVAVGDFNGDSVLDLAVSQPCGTDLTCASTGAVAILLGDGKGSFRSPVYYDSGGFDTVFVTAGDFNGDGK